MVLNSNHDGRKCLSNLLQLEPCNDMYKVISDIMVQWYEMINTFIFTINFCNAMRMNALVFIMGNHYGRKCLTILLQLESRNDIFQVIFVTMANSNELINR